MEMSKRFELQVERLSVSIINGSVNKEAKHQVEVLKQKGPIFGNALGLIWLGVTATCVKSFSSWHNGLLKVNLRNASPGCVVEL
jgi:hypothetical protein